MSTPPVGLPGTTPSTDTDLQSPVQAEKPLQIRFDEADPELVRAVEAFLQGAPEPFTLKAGDSVRLNGNGHLVDDGLDGERDLQVEVTKADGTVQYIILRLEDGEFSIPE